MIKNIFLTMMSISACLGLVGYILNEIEKHQRDNFMETCASTASFYEQADLNEQIVKFCNDQYNHIQQLKQNNWLTGASER